MQEAKSAILDSNKKIVYTLPVVYDSVLELSYPNGIPAMNTVYGVPPTNVKVLNSSSGAAKESVLQVDFTSGDTAQITAHLLNKQQALLTKLKKLRSDVDNVEKLLRKEKSPSSSALPVDSNSGSTEGLKLFANALQKTGGNVGSVKTLIVDQQQSILARLKNLHQKLDEFEQSARLGNKSRTKATSTKRDAGKQMELVVSADASRPPLSLIAMANLLAEHGLVFATTYVHSSAKDVPDKLRTLLKHSSTTDSRFEADFILALIWSDVGVDTTLMVDPSCQNPILAEANIARYVLRILNPNYDTVANLTEFVANDKWLNLASRVLVHGNAKERQSAVRQLNGYLGKSAFLTGPDASIVDAVMFSGLVNAKEYGNLTGNVKKWSQACLQTELFCGIREFL